MARRRFAPLIVAVALGTLVLIARLFQVQILERGTWADQAANLVRAGDVRPYKRGSIFDRRGRVLARDEATYRLQFSYREFRRGHPLGMVAHARSSLLGFTVPLADTLSNFSPWADELVGLTQGQLDDFAAGRPLVLGATTLPACDDPQREDRRSRRGDVRFYITQLLGLDRAAAREFQRATREELDLPFYVLAARARGLSEPDEVRAQLSARLQECAADLDVLARALELDALASGATGDRLRPLDGLVARLERWRQSVADDSASALFSDAVGFSAGRIDASTLAQAVDLEWLARRLRWDPARTVLWLEFARARWLDYLLGGRVERLVAEVELGRRDGELPERILDRWVEAFAGEVAADEAQPGWRDVTALAVLGALDDLFEERDPREGPPFELPFQRGALRAAEPRGAASWSTLARVELGPQAAESAVAALARQWSDAFDEDFDRQFLREHTRALFLAWESELQRAIAESLARRVRSRAASRAPLLLVEGRLERAGERASFVLRDRGSRPQSVSKYPSYETVHLLSRHRDRFAGFSVRDAENRVQARDPRGVAIASGLVGDVTSLTLRESLLESELREQFDGLRLKGTRTDEEEADLVWFARRVARPDEQRGRSGVEAYFDGELAGRNGYREVRGLQDLIDGTFQLDVEPVDGASLTLTLDLDLQEAATRTLAEPEGDPDPKLCDYAWMARPTGAIVLMTVAGDVLAAASYPDVDRDSSASAAPRDVAFERTLRKPTFQPPGSCFKPFVAAWALDHVAFDPAAPELCRMLPDGLGAGYLGVRCSSTWGHDAVGLRQAIQRSCNAYFARLGDRFSQSDWVGLAREFGFGQPTGLRSQGPRPGFREDTVPDLFSRALRGREPRLAGNGLAVVEATPMQLARATAGLATGVLPNVRLVRSVGGVELPRVARPLALSNSSLMYVRDAMFAVANEAGGSAQPALNARELGFQIGAKTGSGDIGVEKVETGDGRLRVRKHTWVIAFLPYEAPRYVAVVFCNDTLQTSSHSAVWVMRQFLRQPEVQAEILGPQERR